MITRRRSWAALVGALVLAGALAGWRLSTGGHAGADTPAFVSVGTATIGHPIAPGFVGLSLEFPAVTGYAGPDPAAINPVLLALIRNLAPGQAPVIRIGGDSTDTTWWPIAGVTPPAGVTHALTDAWIRTTRSLAQTLRARLIMGVNLAADSPAIATAEARAFLSGIGASHIEALELGNEPDLYARDPWYRTAAGKVGFARGRGYTFGSFLDQSVRVASALPRFNLAAPAFAWLPWMNDLGRLLTAQPRVGLVTFHRYPLRRCNQSADSPLYGSIPNLLSDFSSSGLAAPLARFAAVAHGRGLSFRVDEMNSVSCHGKPGVSDSFASALWALDTMFNFARAGVDGVNIHTFPGASYQLFVFQNRRGRWTASVKPEYYGLEMFAAAAPAGSRLLRTDAPRGSVSSWATLSPNGTTRLVLINERGARPQTVVIRPPDTAGVASITRLLAPGPAATSGVTLDGESFGPRTQTGTLPRPARQGFLVSAGGRYAVTLPPASAAMLTLIPGMSASLPAH